MRLWICGCLLAATAAYADPVLDFESVDLNADGAPDLAVLVPSDTGTSADLHIHFTTDQFIGFGDKRELGEPLVLPAIVYSGGIGAKPFLEVVRRQLRVVGGAAARERWEEALTLSFPGNTPTLISHRFIQTDTSAAGVWIVCETSLDTGKGIVEWSDGLRADGQDDEKNAEFEVVAAATTGVLWTFEAGRPIIEACRAARTE